MGTWVMEALPVAQDARALIERCEIAVQVPRVPLAAYLAALAGQLAQLSPWLVMSVGMTSVHVALERRELGQRQRGAWRVMRSMGGSSARLRHGRIAQARRSPQTVAEASIVV